MRVAVVSDIHANRHAFEAVLAAIGDEEVDAVWCLGDLVGYGGEPDACVTLAMERCDLCLVGNHDLAVIDFLSLNEFSGPAAAAARWTSKVLKSKSRKFLESLSPTGEEAGIELFHASPRDPIWEYVLSDWIAEMSMDEMNGRIALVGHSHVPLSFSRADHEADGAVHEPGDEVDLSSATWILNPGSVGQPRDGDPRASWLVLDIDAEKATWKRTEYDIDGAAAAILDAGLPEILAERLHHGQ